MFRGISSITLDAKGRLAIPTRYREELQENFDSQLVLTVGVDDHCSGELGCLWLYPLAEWEKVEQTLSKLPTLDKRVQKLKRFLIGNASECEMDNQGRLLLPEKLREFARMDKKVILIGQLNKFEIWSDAAWQVKEEEWLLGDESDEGMEALSNISF